MSSDAVGEGSLCPEPDQVVRVIGGDAQILVRLADGRHIQVGAVAAGEVVIGSAGLHILPSPEAHVTVVPDATAADRMTWESRLQEWSRLDGDESVAGMAAALDDIARARAGLHDQRRLARVAARTQRNANAIRDGVDSLTDAVGGVSALRTIADVTRRDEMQAVATVAQALGFAPDPDALTSALAAVDQGADPVHAMATASGLVARPVTLPPDWFHKDGAPAVVTLTDPSGQSLTRAIIWQRGWRLIDDESGDHRTMTPDQATRVSRQAVELVPRLPDAPATQRELRRFCLRGSRNEWVILGATSLVVGVVAFITPILVGKIGSAVTVGTSTGALVGLFLALVLLAVALAFWRAIRSAAVSRLRSRIEARAFAALWDRSVRQSLKWHRTIPSTLRSKWVLAPDRAAGAVDDDVVAHLLDAVVIVGSLVAVATTTVPLMVGIFGSLVLEGMVLWLLVRRAGRRSVQIGAHSGVAAAQIAEAIAQIDEVRIWGAEAYVLREWTMRQAPAATLAQQARRNTMQRMVVAAIWPVVTLGVLVAVSAVSETTFAQFVTAQTAGVAAAMTLATVMSAVNAWLIGRAAMHRVDPLLESTPESGDPPPGRLAGAIEACGLTFGIDRSEPILRDVSFDVSPGEFVVITGAMGAGKSMLVECLLGVLAPTAGTVLLDGHDLGSLDGDAVRRQIGSILQLQGTPLMPTTIRENVTVGRPFTSNEVWSALDAVGVGKDVRAMALGLDTHTSNDGSALSSGQRQQLLLARALIGDPRMLVWDAAMGALDAAALDRVLAALSSRPITRIVVSHDPGVVSLADRVILLSEGRVAEQGTHEDLLTRCELYRQLMGVLAPR